MTPASLFLDAIIDNCTTIFGDLGIEVTLTDDPLIPTSIAVIGFSSGNITGSVGIACSDQLLTDSLSATFGGSPPPETSRRDWLGELCNQFLGAIKRAVSDYGVDVNMATPTIVDGKELSVDLSRDCAGSRTLQTSGGDKVMGFFDLQHEEGLELVYAPPEEDGLEDGMSLFF